VVSGISPLALVPAFIGAIVAFASLLLWPPYNSKDFADQPWRCLKRTHRLGPRADRLLILTTVVAVNVISNSLFSGLEKTAPVLGSAFG